MPRLETRAAQWEKTQAHSGNWILYKKGLTPMERAAQRRNAEHHVQEALWLLAQGVNLKINKVSQDVPKITVLHLASHFGMTAEIKQLLKYGADPKHLTKDGMAPWMEAAIMHHKKALDILLPVQPSFGWWNKFRDWIYPQKDLQIQTEMHLRTPKKALTLGGSKSKIVHASVPSAKPKKKTTVHISRYNK